MRSPAPPHRPGRLRPPARYKGDDVNHKVDERNRLSVPGIHDGILAEFSYRRGQQIYIKIAGSRGESISITMGKIHILNINNLGEGSIIDSVYIWNVIDFPDSDWMQQDIGWNSLLEGRANTDFDIRTEANRLCRHHSAAMLATVTCSIGGNWSIMCSEIILDCTTKDITV